MSTRRNIGRIAAILTAKSLRSPADRRYTIDRDFVSRRISGRRPLSAYWRQEKPISGPIALMERMPLLGAFFQWQGSIRLLRCWLLPRQR
jgi:hypothetical protein